MRRYHPVVDLVVALAMIGASVAAAVAATHGLAPPVMFTTAFILWTLSIVLLVR